MPCQLPFPPCREAATIVKQWSCQKLDKNKKNPKDQKFYLVPFGATKELGSLKIRRVRVAQCDVTLPCSGSQAPIPLKPATRKTPQKIV
jgi:hypothetical protein